VGKLQDDKNVLDCTVGGPIKEALALLFRECGTNRRGCPWSRNVRRAESADE
jgi:hypothetical protein